MHRGTMCVNCAQYFEQCVVDVPVCYHTVKKITDVANSVFCSSCVLAYGGERNANQADFQGP